MNIYDPMAMAWGIEPRIDIKEYPKTEDLLEENPPHTLATCPVKWTDDMRKECGDRQRIRLQSGNHYFCNNTEHNNNKIKDGTHTFVNSEAQRERAKRPRKRSPKIYVAEANRERMSKGQHIQVSTVICPHCGKEGNYMVMKRWHFDKCKNYSSSSSRSIP